MSSSITNSDSIAEPTVIAGGQEFLTRIREDWMVLANQAAVNQALASIGPVGVSVNGPQQLLVGTLEIGLNANWSYGPKHARKTVKGHYKDFVEKPLSHIEWPLIWTKEEPSRKFPIEVVEVRNLGQTQLAIKDIRSQQSQNAKSQVNLVNMEKKGKLADAEQKSVNLAKEIEEENKKMKKETEERIANENERRKAEEGPKKTGKEAQKHAIKEAKKELHIATMHRFAAENAEKKAYENYMRLLQKQ